MTDLAHYGTLADADAWHVARGRAWLTSSTPDRTAALVRASDYVDSLRAAYTGAKVDGRDQFREWPRVGATDTSGNAIPDDEVPIEIERATYELAEAERVSPGVLAPTVDAAKSVQSESFGGMYSVTYAGLKSLADAQPQVMAALRWLDVVMSNRGAVMFGESVR